MNYRSFVQAASIHAHYEREAARARELDSYTRSACDLARAAFPEARVERVFSYVRLTLPAGSREAEAMRVIRKIHGDRFFLYRDHGFTGRRYEVSYMRKDLIAVLLDRENVPLKRHSYTGFLLIRDGECCIQFSDYDITKALG